MQYVKPRWTKSYQAPLVHAADTVPGAVATGRLAEWAFRWGARSLPLPVPYQCRLVRFRRGLSPLCLTLALGMSAFAFVEVNSRAQSAASASSEEDGLRSVVEKCFVAC